MGEFCLFSWGNGGGWGVSYDGVYMAIFITVFTVFFDLLLVIFKFNDKG